MSYDPLAEADAAVSYQAPTSLPISVLAVQYGESHAVPDTVASVEVTWAFRDRPGVFLAVQDKVGDWRGAMDALLRLRVFQLETIYNLLGGWPEPTPLPTDVPPDPGTVYVPDQPPGFILPPGVIGQE